MGIVFWYNLKKKLIQKKIHVIGTMEVASMPQPEMVDKPFCSR